MLLGVLLLIAWLFKQPAVKGKIGELFVSFCLKFWLDPKMYRVCNNVMIPDDKGGTTQIDHIVFSQYGIFVVETKNMKGWIWGNAEQAEWTQQIFKVKHPFQNPFRQNYKHIKCLTALTGLPEDVFVHIIAFVGDCTIKRREKLPETLVTGGLSMAKVIKSYRELRLDLGELEAAMSTLGEGKVANSRQNQKDHISHVRAIIQEKSVSPEPLCPKCGSPMVLRTAKSSGNSFWGCSAFPQCRGIRQV